MKTIRAQIYLICSVLCLSIVLGLMPSQKAAAAGETWEWLNGTFHVRGGDLASQTTFTFVREERGAQHGNDTGTFNIYQGTLQHRNNCTIDMTLFIPLSNTTIIYTDVTGGSCSGAIQAAYDNLTASTEDNSGGGGNDGVGNFQWGSNRALIQTYGINIFSGGTRTTTLPIAAGDTSPQVTISPLGGYFVNPAWAQVNPAPPPDQLPENDKGIYVAGQVVDVVATINNGVGDLGKNTYRCTMRYQLQLTSNESPNSAHLTSWTDRPSATAQIEVENFQYADGRTWTAPDAATFCEMVENSFELDLPETVTIYGDPGGIVAVTPLQVPEGSDDPVTAPGTPDVDPCAQNNGPMGWILCPMQHWMIDIASGIDRIIVETLIKIDTEAIFADSPYTTLEEGETTNDIDENITTTTAFREAWEAFRNIAYALLVIFGLIMVVSQIIGLELFDAYTIRKMLPRLVLAAIILPLLWPLLAFLFNMANDSANAVQTIMISPFADLRITLDTGEVIMREFTTAAMVGTIIAAVGLALGSLLLVGGWGILFALVASVVIGILSAFFVLMARDIVAYILIIASPIAVLCAVFEPFRKGFALWRSYLLTILLSIPAIMAVLTAGKIAAGVAMITNQNMGPILGLLFVVVSYVMFWPVFKRLDKVSGMIDDTTSKVTSLAQKPLRRYMGKRAMQTLGDVARRKGNANNWLTKATQSVVAGASDLRHVRGLNVRRWGAQIQNARPRDLTDAMKEFEEDADLAALRSDDVLHAAARDTSAEGKRGDRRAVRSHLENIDKTTDRYKDLSEDQKRAQMDRDEEAILLAHQRLGAHASRVLTATLLSTGSNNGESVGDTLERIYEESRGDLSMQATLWNAVKERALKAGRTDYGVRQGGALAAIKAYGDTYEAVVGTTVTDASGTRVITPDEAKQIARQKARETAIDLAFDQQGASAIIQGRPEVSDEAAEYLVRKRKRAVETLGAAQSQLAANPEGTPGHEEALKGLDAARREYEHTIADTEALVDVVAYASPEKGRKLAGGLGYEIDLDRPEFAPLKLELESRFEERYPGAIQAWEEWEVDARDAAADGNPIPEQPKVPRLPRKFTERDLARLTENYGLMPDLASTIDERRRRLRDQMGDPAAFERIARGGAPPTGTYTGFGGGGTI